MSKPVSLFLVFVIGCPNLFAQNWIQKGSDMDGEAAGDQSGHSVSMSSDGNTVAIGAIGNDGNGEAAGHVRVYSWNGLAWTQKGSDIDGEAAGDQASFSLSMSSDGSTVAIGAIRNVGNGEAAGHVRVYSWGGLAWIQKGSDIDGEATGDWSGHSVSMSSDGHTIAIGAVRNEGNGKEAGHVRVYSWRGSTWRQKGSDIDGEAPADLSGHSVSLSSDGNTIAIGAIGNAENGYASGHVRVHSWTDSAWTQKGSDIDGEAVTDLSGHSVSLSSDGNTVAIGAYKNDKNGTDAGHVRVYSWIGSAWTKKGSDIDGEAAEDQSGYSVSISWDGNTVAIGAPFNDGNRRKAGHVRVYSWSGSAWTQKGSDIDGEVSVDRSGWSISISAEGYTVAVGAELNDGNGNKSGQVRVFRYGFPTGISMKVIGSAIVYPNPSTDNFTLNLGQTYPGIELKITDVLGEIVVSKNVESASEVQFEIQGKPGVYLVEIWTNAGLLTTAKVIKE